MKTTITYQLALERHPDHVANVLAQLQNGKSKEKGTAPESFEWSYLTAERIEGDCSFQGMINRIKNPPPPPTLQQRIQNRLKNITTYLHAKKGHWQGYCEQPLETLPPEVIQQVTDTETKAEANHLYFESLTPAQRQAETEEILKELRKDKGLMEIRL